MRRAGLHPEFERMTLLTKFEAYNERLELWAHPLPTKAIQHFILWRVEGTIVRFAQLMQLNSAVGGMVVNFPAEATKLVQEVIGQLFVSEFNYHMNLVYTWTAIGNDWMPSYQNMAVDRWENAQLAKLNGGGSEYGLGRGGQQNHTMMEMLGWFFGAGEGKPVEDETIGKLPEKKEEEFPPQQNDGDLDLPSASEDDNDIWNWGTKPDAEG